MRKTLAEYRAELEPINGGTIPVAYALEILEEAERVLEERHGEYTLSQAIQISGHSRKWFERRMERWMSKGLARREGRTVLLKYAVIPNRPDTRGRAFDPAMDADEIASRLVA